MKKRRADTLLEWTVIFTLLLGVLAVTGQFIKGALRGKGTAFAKYMLWGDQQPKYKVGEITFRQRAKSLQEQNTVLNQPIHGIEETILCPGKNYSRENKVVASVEGGSAALLKTFDIDKEFDEYDKKELLE